MSRRSTPQTAPKIGAGEKYDAIDLADLIARATSDLKTLQKLLLKQESKGFFPETMDSDGINDADQYHRSNLAKRAERMYSARRRSAERALSAGVPDGPPVDMLLDLFISENEGRKVSVSDTSLAARCPQTTGLRWVHLLIEYGLIYAEPDKSDNRRRIVHLTRKGQEAVVRLLGGPIGIDVI